MTTSLGLRVRWDHSKVAEIALAAHAEGRNIALINGGPCPTCGGHCYLPPTGLGIVEGSDGDPCPNPDCVDGRVPGIAERLEELHKRLRMGIGYVTPSDAVDLATVIADLRHLGGGE